MQTARLFALPLALCVLLFAVNAEAATRTWDGGGADSLWSTAANWSSDLVPGAGDNALFDGTNTKAASIPVNTTVGGLEIRSAYTGTITQSGGAILTIGTGSFVQGGGTFKGGTGSTFINTHFTLSGGTVVAPSKALSVAKNFTRTGGNFTPNHGTLLLNPRNTQTFTPGGISYGNVAINDGLVGYWKFDETSGTTAKDRSGYGNNGTYAPDVTISSNVPSTQFSNGRSVSINGLQTFPTGPITMGVVPQHDFTNNFTVSAWINATGWGNPGALQFPGIVSHISAGTYKGWVLGENCDSGTRLAFITQDGVGSSSSVCVDANPSTGAWHHLLGVVRNGTQYIYLDGVQQSETAASKTNISSPTTKTMVGRFYDNNTFFTFYGLIDEVRLYNRALSASEIAALAAGGQPGTASGSVTLSGNLALSGSLLLHGGTFDVSSSNYGITLSGSWLNSGGLFTKRTATVTLNGVGPAEVLSGGQSFNALSLSTPNTTIDDALSASTFSKVTSSADTLTFFAGSDLSVTSSLTLRGSSNGSLSLRSTSAGTPWKLNIPGSRSFAYLDVKDSTNLSTLPLECLTGCVDSGNNRGWLIPAPVSTDSSSTTASTSGHSGGGGGRRVNSTVAPSSSGSGSGSVVKPKAAVKPAQCVRPTRRGSKTLSAYRTAIREWRVCQRKK